MREFTPTQAEDLYDLVCERCRVRSTCQQEAQRARSGRHRCRRRSVAGPIAHYPDSARDVDGDSEAVETGAAAASEPLRYVDLGHGVRTTGLLLEGEDNLERLLKAHGSLK